MAITIEMPRLSDSMHEGIVLRWVKKIGDFVEVGDHLADIETDKAHVELQACEDGTLMEILVPEGGSAAVGAPIALLQSEFGAASCDCPPCPPVKCSPLAAISTPIAVQCEKLIGGRYSLFDYVVRAAVKACISEPEWLAGDSAAELLMVLDKGEKYVFIENASGKTIYNIAMERLAAPAAGPPPAGSITPNILLCDSGVNVEAQRTVLPEMPHSIISIGGTTPKTGIEAGRPVSKLILPVTLYVNANILPECKASRIAAEFKTLLENPVLLLL